MSLALEPEDVVKIVDPRTDLDKPIKYVVEDGSQSVSWVQIASTQAGGNSSQISFTQSNPPGPRIIMDKKVYIRMGFRIVFTGTPAAGLPLIGYENIGDPTNNGLVGYPAGTNYIRPLGTDGPRAYPIAQSMSSLVVRINDGTVTEPVYDYIEPLLRYNNPRDLSEQQYSTTPNKHDQFPEYNYWVNRGSARNVLGDYGEDDYLTNRGGFTGVYMVQNPLGDGVNPVTAIFELDCMEPLFISPLGFSAENERGLIGVYQFQVNINVVGDLTRVWSHDAVLGQPISSAVCTIGSQRIPRPELQFNYLTPKSTQVIPSTGVYPHFRIDNFPKDYISQVPGYSLPNGSLNSLASVTQFTSDTVNLMTIPKRIYIFVRESNQTRTFNSSDTYARIDRLSINFNNKNSLVAGANTQNLYEMSVKNGLKMSWTQWNQQVGSVCCVDFSNDISLTDDQAVGLLSNSLQLQITVDFTNLSNTPKFFTLYMTPTYPGIFNIAGKQAIAQVGIFNRADIINSPNIHRLELSDFETFYGGGLGAQLHSVYEKHIKPNLTQENLQKAISGLSTAADVAGDVISPFAPRVGAVLDLVGKVGSSVDKKLSEGLDKKSAQSIVAQKHNLPDDQVKDICKEWNKHKKLMKSADKRMKSAADDLSMMKSQMEGGKMMTKKQMQRKLMQRAIKY